MARQVGAPISAVLQLRSNVDLNDVAGLLGSWLQQLHGVGLQSAEHQDLVVEWRTADDDAFACQLVVSDSHSQVRRVVTVLRDSAGAVAIVEEAPLAHADTPHAVVDLSESVRLLLDMLLSITASDSAMKRDVLNDFGGVDPHDLLAVLQKDLAPGVLAAVVPDDDCAPTTAQRTILDDLRGLALVGSIPVRAKLLGELGTSALPRSGSIVSISRTSLGLDAHLIGSTALRTKPESARRLVVRRHLAAPTPFDLERRRSAAMKKLAASGPEIDLPTALELLEEESERANTLDNRIKELDTQLERAFEEQDTAISELDNALSRLRYLERAFRELGEVPTIESDFDDDWVPDSTVDALVAAQELLPFLIISPNEATCQVLDGQQKRSIWAKKIWLSLRALNDYCRTKAEGRFSGDIARYRDNTPSGAIPLLSEYSPHESESTTNSTNLKAIRTFDVPTTIDPAGKVYMEQHLKIDRGGKSAPRIHLYDDSGGLSQRIYIGYVGPHLPTSSSF